MKETQVLARLESIVNTEMPMLKNNLFLRTDDGYEVFDLYIVKQQDDMVSVTKGRSSMGTFTTVKTALSWCIADNYQQNQLAESIRKLDADKKRVSEDVNVRRVLLRGFKNTDRREAVELKVQMRQYKLTDLNEQLDKCINLAKYWQLRGFNNEIARTRHTTSNKKHR